MFPISTIRFEPGDPLPSGGKVKALSVTQVEEYFEAAGHTDQIEKARQRFPEIAAAWEAHAARRVSEARERGVTVSQLVSDRCELEEHARMETLFRRRLKRCHQDAKDGAQTQHMTFARFDWKLNAQADDTSYQRIRNWCSSVFYPQSTSNLLLWGPTGRGKTHLMHSSLVQLMTPARLLSARERKARKAGEFDDPKLNDRAEKGLNAQFWVAGDLLRWIQAGNSRTATLGEQERLDRVTSVDVLGLDEIGYEGMTGKRRELLFRIVQRMEHRGWIIATTNMSPNGLRDWVAKPDGETDPQDLLERSYAFNSRLLGGNSVVCRLHGRNDYRLKDKLAKMRSSAGS